MTRRKFLILSSIGALNSAIFLGCHIWLAITPTSGPEGISAAFCAYTSVFLSVILSAFALECLYADLQRKSLGWKTPLATVLSIAPLIFFLLVDFLPYHTHNR